MNGPEFTQEDYDRVKFMPMAKELLGCSWGKMISSTTDKDECPNKAKRIMVLYQGGRQVEVRLCEGHEAVVMEHSDPHQEAS